MDFRVTTDFKVKQISLAFRIPFTKQTNRFSWQIYRDPNAWCVGIGSQCKDGRHVLFFDYDGKELKQVLGDLKFLQEIFKLSNAYVFQLDRPDSFHAIILDKFSVLEAYKILKEANSDWGHKESVKKVRGHEWLLRSGPKGARDRPIWRGTLISKHQLREVSTAHKRFIEINYSVPKIKYKKEDNIKEVPVIDYNTGNRVDMEEPKNFEGNNG